jgi:hypothetical protein
MTTGDTAVTRPPALKYAKYVSTNRLFFLLKQNNRSGLAKSGMVSVCSNTKHKNKRFNVAALSVVYFQLKKKRLTGI